MSITIHEKIEKLIALYKASLLRCKQLEHELELVKHEREILKSNIEEFQSTKDAIKMTTFAKGLSDEERSELKKTINDYIKEIDYCIKALDQ